VHFGTALATSADAEFVLVGAPGDDANLGAAWVYRRAGGAYLVQAKLVGLEGVYVC
jgi:hypothetical protein